MLNSRHIEIFYSVYKYKTLTNAAKILNVSQPALSKSLQYLEHKLNLKLFTKQSGMLVPTPEADLLYRNAEKINLSVKEFNQIAANLSGSPSNFIEIGITPSLGTSFLPEILAKFTQLEPDIKFNIHNSQSHELMDKLYDFSHDIVLCYNPPKSDLYNKITLQKGEMVFIISSDNPNYVSKTEISLKELSKEQLIKVSNVLEIEDDFSVEQALIEKNIRPDWIASTETFHVAKKMVEKGIAGSIIDSITANSGKTNEIKILKLRPAIKFTICAIQNPNKPSSVAVKRFIEFLRSQKKQGELGSPC
jgi:DNA-binding transcriptional LysR family regulator